ncbi:MAG: peptidyl-prolyl cis-trans isomerase [Sphingomonadales bacterium]|nr:peptidyl-prolyl cis-trans isomerase [Sphingomonadales bacterium]MBK9002400.1 peptidyl-prolyl cis-trans isomerase [Sphingomonadales bacterium]MBK9267630.1 peptidyl-prolyl cis-trans isomerase [Sphingomonadales bacterium]MBP6435004.1 peptidyl-prolyl cis-trans isomerase [Sphingorhabdus sp.]
MREKLQPLLREPLVHFLLAGLAVFLFSAWRGEEVDPASRTITIDEEQVSRLVASWQQTWQRPPTPAEIDGLIRDHIKGEVYYREARRLGLDEDDTVIRRRLRAKMEYLAAAQVENVAADDATLQRWLDRHAARYAGDAVYSFDQIYLGQDDAAAGRVKAALAAGGDWSKLGATISLPGSLQNALQSEIARDFGEGFAAALADAKTGEWSGPIRSGFGQHLVRIRSVTTPEKPKLADVRQAVENDWRAATVKAREAAAYQALLDGYTIKIAKP